MQHEPAPAERLHLMLPPDVHAPAAARRALRTLPLGEHEVDVLLLASELVASALVQDGAQPIELFAACEPGRLRVEVRDHSHGLSAGGLADGYGLQVLTAASVRWGIEQDDTTRAWFELGQ
jgi:hypothetical protein